MKVYMVVNGVTCPCELSEESVRALTGENAGSISPAQWAALIAAIVNAILALFVPPAAGAKPGQPAGK